MKAIYIGKPIPVSGGSYLCKDTNVVILAEIPPNSDNEKLIRVKQQEGGATHMVFLRELEFLGDGDKQIS